MVLRVHLQQLSASLSPPKKPTTGLFCFYAWPFLRFFFRASGSSFWLYVLLFRGLWHFVWTRDYFQCFYHPRLPPGQFQFHSTSLYCQHTNRLVRGQIYSRNKHSYESGTFVTLPCPRFSPDLCVTQPCSRPIKVLPVYKVWNLHAQWFCRQLRASCNHIFPFFESWSERWNLWICFSFPSSGLT